MTKMRNGLLVVLMIAVLGFVKADDQITLASVPPVVVKSTPQSGAEDVDPDLTEIAITFSKDMTDGSWSWTTASKESFPETTGKPHYLDDKRTCVFPVRLKPGTTYATWINSAKFSGFKDADGHPAVPYLLVFETKR